MSDARIAGEKTTLDKLNSNSSWYISSLIDEDNEQTHVTVMICDEDEHYVGVRLKDLICASELQFSEAPNDAEWTANQLRKLANIIDSYRKDAVRCKECGELFNPKVWGCCGDYPGVLSFPITSDQEDG